MLCCTFQTPVPRLPLLGHTDSLSTAASGLCVLTLHAQSPVVPESTMIPTEEACAAQWLLYPRERPTQLAAPVRPLPIVHHPLICFHNLQHMPAAVVQHPLMLLTDKTQITNSL